MTFRFEEPDMTVKPIHLSMMLLALVASHVTAYRAGAALSRLAMAEQARSSAIAASRDPAWVPATSAPPNTNSCSALRTQLDEAQAENKDLTARLDQNNALWRSVLLGPDAANRSDDDDDDDAKQADSPPQTGGWLNGPPTPVHPLCMARCDLIQKWSSCKTAASS